VVVPEGVLVEIPLEILCADRMVHAGDAALQQSEEPLDGVGVNTAAHIDLRAVINAPMDVASARKILVGGQFVGIDDGRRKNMFANVGNEGSRCPLRQICCAEFPLALDLTRDDGLVAQPVPSGITAIRKRSTSTDIGFVRFNGIGSRESPNILSQEFPNLRPHPPRGFIGNAEFSLNLLGRHSAARGRHLKDRVEPQVERRGGFLEDRPGGGVDMVSTEVTTVRRTALDAMMLGDPLAERALNTIRIKEVSQPLQANGIVGEVAAEVSDRVLSHSQRLT